MSKPRFVGAVLLNAVVAMAAAGCGAEPGEAPGADEENARFASQEQSAAGDTVNVCASTLTPAGWADVQWWKSATCGSTASPNAKQMKQLTGYPVGTRVNVCSSTYPPDGWSITSSYFSSSCQYSAVPSLNNNSWTLVRSY